MGKERARPEFLNFEVVSAMICFALLGRSVISYQTITLHSRAALHCLKC